MKRLVIVVVVLVGLLVALDFGAAALAESAVSRQMREQLGLADDPSVRINGFPFLTQALSGEYRSVDVSAARLRVGELQEVEVRAQLRGVMVPLSTLLGSGPLSVPVREVEGTVRIGPGDLERLLPDVERIRVENLDEEALAKVVENGGDPALAQLDPETAVRFVVTTAALGPDTEIAVIATLRLADQQIEVTPLDVRLADEDAPPLSATDASGRLEAFTVGIDPGTLPLDVTATEVRARDGALEISGVARNRTLGAPGPARG